MKSEIKPLGGLERVKLADAVPLSTPFTLYIFPTTFCNFKCNYCAHSQPEHELKEQYGFAKETMTMETFDKIVEQLKAFPQKLKVISLTGHGEPLLNKNLPEMIRKIKQANVTERIEIISNGSLLTHELSDKLIGAGLDILRISLQGLTSSKYKEVCEADVIFNNLIDNLAYFYNNRKQSQLFVKIIDVAMDEGDDKRFYEIFENISNRMYIEYCQRVYSGVESTKDKEFNSSSRYGQDFPKQEVCPLSFFMLGIYPAGDVIPCDIIYKPVILGNVNNTALLDMWTGKTLHDFRVNQLENGRFTNPECARCCTPDDVLRPEDILDDSRHKILERLRGK